MTDLIQDLCALTSIAAFVAVFLTYIGAFA